MIGSVSIRRCSDGTIRLRIEDELSRIAFVEAVMLPEDFASAVTGLAFQEAEIHVHGLEYVGKQEVREDRTINCPLSYYTERESLEAWLENNGKEPGWIVDSSLCSIDSITDRRDDGCTLHYSVVKYVETEGAK